MKLENAQTRTGNLNIRVTKAEADDVQYCARRLGITKTEVIIQGVHRIKEEIDHQRIQEA